MDRELRRRLNLLDLLILIAGSAGGFALGRHFAFSQNYQGNVWLARTEAIVEAYALVMTLAILIIRLRQPRPVWALLRRQPGLIACLAIVLMVVAESVRGIPYWWIFSRSQSYYPMWLGSIIGYYGHGQMVIAAWMTLAVSGAWKSDRSVIDRLGCAIGVFYIAAHGLLPLIRWLLV